MYFTNYAPPGTFASQEDLLANYGAVIGQALAQPGIVTTAEDHDSPDDHYTHILIIGTSEAEALILTYLSVWAQFYPFAPFPLITVTDGAVMNMEDIVNNAFGTPELAAFAPTLQTNLRGTQPLIFDAENTAAFFTRYQKQFGALPPAAAGLSYDAGMATMLAMVTVSVEEAVSGAGIADGMASLVDRGGTEVSFGDPPDDFVPTARNTLAAGNTIDLVGMSGDLNWDPGSGEIRTDVLGWHVGDGEAGDPVILDPSCQYTLFPEPAEDGIWVSLPGGMPPCN